MALVRPRQLMSIVGISALLCSYLLIVWIVVEGALGSGDVLVSTVSVGGLAEKATDIATVALTLPFVVWTARSLSTNWSN
jgi:hypothetical protein